MIQLVPHRKTPHDSEASETEKPFPCGCAMAAVVLTALLGMAILEAVIHG